MLSEERYYRQKNDYYTYELSITNFTFPISISYEEGDKYSLEIDYDELPELVKFSFEDIQEVEEALVVAKNHMIL